MYYKVCIYLERMVLDQLAFNDDEDYLILYTFNRYKSSRIKRVVILDINDDCIELIMRSHDLIDKAVIHESVTMILSSIQSKIKRLDVSRKYESIRRIDYSPIKKKVASIEIKTHYKRSISELKSYIKEPYLKYFKLIRFMLKRLNNDNLKKVIPTFSTIMIEEPMSRKFIKGLFFLFRTNYFTMHRLIDAKHLKRCELEKILYDSYQNNKIIMLPQEQTLFSSSKIKTHNNKHGIIMTCLNENGFSNSNCHFVIKNNSKVVSLLEKTIVDETMIELNKLIGLNNMKETVKKILIHQYVNQVYHDGNEKISNHFAFLGGPGTGKTTVARLLSSFFYKVGLLDKGHTIEVDRSHLVGEFVGKTAIKTSDILKSSEGGILFIDEAYSLYGEGRDFGREAINTITKYMEDHRYDLVTVFAGYKEPMEEMMSLNEGLKGRIDHHIDFDNYSSKEMCLIFKYLCNEEEFRYEDFLLEKLYQYFEIVNEKMRHGRFVRSIFESIKREYAYRIFYGTETYIKYLISEDFKEPIGEKKLEKVIGFRRI